MANVFRAPLLTPPPKRPILGVDLFPNLLLTTLAVAASLAPFRPADLPTPMRARTVTQTDIPPNLLATTLKPASIAPFVQFDWPIVRRLDASGSQTLYVSVYQQPVTVQAPFSQADWPTPARARFVQTAESGEISLSLLNAAYGGSAATSELFPNPTGRKYWAPDDSPPNLLVSTLKPTATNPFYQLDWPNPVRARIAPQAESASGATTRGIPPPSPVKPIDWPNPARARWVPTSESGEISLPLLNAAYGGSAATSELFPNPTGRGYWPQVDIPPNLLTGTLSAAVPKPFAQSDWTNPARRPYLQLEQRQAYMVSGITWDTRVLLWDSAAITWDGGAMGALPFLVPDQANPPARRPYWQLDQVINPLPSRTPATQAPFSQTDWPTPARARPVPLGESGEISLSLLNANFGGSAATAEDFPNPSGRKYWPQVDIPPNLLATTLKPAATNPFYQLDWPNPVRARIAAQAESVPGATTRGIPPPPPVLPIDWPNPAARKPARFDDPPNLLAGTLKPAASNPFSPVDQSVPQPRRAVLQVDPVPNALILGIPAAGAAPFAQLDWPLFARQRATPPIDYLLNAPMLAPLAVGTLTAIQDWPLIMPRRQIPVEIAPNLAIRLLAQTAPFRLTDWPNPALRARTTPQGHEPGAAGLYLTLLQRAPFTQLDWPLFTRQRAIPPIEYLVNAPLVLGASVPVVSTRFTVNVGNDRTISVGNTRTINVGSSRKVTV